MYFWLLTIGQYNIPTFHVMKLNLTRLSLFPLHFTVLAYFLIEYKTSFTISLLFCVKHLLIICSHFVLLIKFGSVASERFAPCHLNACPQRGWSTKIWVSSLFLLRKKSLTRPSDLSWQEKKNMTGQEILSNC
jgi:hypothetical protein